MACSSEYIPRNRLAAGLCWRATLSGTRSCPSAQEISQYCGVHAAGARGEISTVLRLVQQKRQAVNARDLHGRTPLMVAGYKRDVAIATELVAAGADVNSRDSQAYDLITIVAVANDVPMLRMGIASGDNTGLVTRRDRFDRSGVSRAC